MIELKDRCIRCDGQLFNDDEDEVHCLHCGWVKYPSLVISTVSTKRQYNQKVVRQCLILEKMVV